MTAPTLDHPCNTDPFAVCECGRLGAYAFGSKPYPTTARVIEAVFEFVERLADGQTFTEPQVYRHCRAQERHHFSSSTVTKVVRIMEHHQLVRRLHRGVGGKGRPIVWQRAAPVGAS